MESDRSATKLGQRWGSWATLGSHLYDDPKVEKLMKTRLGLYLSAHPFLALNLVLFGVLAALPLGLFLVFAAVTLVISAVGFVFFEAFLLFVAGVTLLWVLSGIALFSIVVSSIVIAFYATIPSVLNYYHRHLAKGVKSHMKSNGCDTSNLKQ